jgi:SAM-dependent methyltransferase
MAEKKVREFYEGAALVQCGRTSLDGEAGHIRAWLDRLPPHLAGLPVLELGCGRGPLREVARTYVGCDLSVRALASGEPFRALAADMEQLPLMPSCVGAVFSWAAIEHVPHPEQVLEGIATIVAPGGMAILKPAWHCRPWAAEGLEFRNASELSPMQRVRKAVIPLRNSLLLRTPPEMLRRIAGEMALRRRVPLEFRYTRLKPNLESYVGTDSDAFSSMDPHAMLLWFISRGWTSPSHPGRRARLLARNEAIVVQKPASSPG